MGAHVASSRCVTRVASRSGHVSTTPAPAGNPRQALRRADPLSLGFGAHLAPRRGCPPYRRRRRPTQAVHIVNAVISNPASAADPPLPSSRTCADAHNARIRWYAKAAITSRLAPATFACASASACGEEPSHYRTSRLWRNSPPPEAANSPAASATAASAARRPPAACHRPPPLVRRPSSTR